MVLVHGLLVILDSRRFSFVESGDGSTLVPWASRDSLVGLKYVVRWYGADTG